LSLLLLSLPSCLTSSSNPQKDGTISQLQTENTELQTENTQKDGTISQLQTENTQKDGTISQLVREIIYFHFLNSQLSIFLFRNFSCFFQLLVQQHIVFF
jgi:peptidoglycan hydrolase CwlO-like protein